MNNSVPEVSVIMGVYNSKSQCLLEESIRSIINQTFQNWEFLICNDGSTDNTLEILNEIQKLDSRIKILSYEENKGLANALNVCLENAKGKFIARQDDDDVSYPMRLERQLNFLHKNVNYAFVGCIADLYDGDSIYGDYILKENPEKKEFLWNSPFIHPTVMFRKEALEKVSGYRVAKETRRCEDYDLFMRIYSIGLIGHNIQEKLYRYRFVLNNEKKYRPMKYRLDELVVRYRGYKNMGILLMGLPYILKPILVGVLPASLYKFLKTGVRMKSWT